MLKLFYFLMILPIMFCSQVTTIENIFTQESNVVIYKDNQVVELTVEEKSALEDLFLNVFENAIQSPSFAVCINEMVQKDIQQGYWIKFVYEDTQIKDEMPYDELLIHIEKDNSNVNIMRGNDGIFEGRCFHYDLENNMNKIYNFIENLKQNSLEEIEIELESQENSPTFIEKEEKSDKDDDIEEKSQK